MNSSSVTTQGDIDHEKNHLLQQARRYAEAASLTRQAATKLGVLAPADHLRLLEEARDLERKCADLVRDAFDADKSFIDECIAGRCQDV